jgi:hypothetical protein
VVHDILEIHPGCGHLVWLTDGRQRDGGNKNKTEVGGRQKTAEGHKEMTILETSSLIWKTFSRLPKLSDIVRRKRGMIRRNPYNRATHQFIQPPSHPCQVTIMDQRGTGLCTTKMIMYGCGMKLQWLAHIRNVSIQRNILLFSTTLTLTWEGQDVRRLMSHARHINFYYAPGGLMCYLRMNKDLEGSLAPSS